MSLVALLPLLVTPRAEAGPDDPPPAYPRSALLRPRTLPGGAFEGGVVLKASDAFDAYGAVVHALYSPVDRLQLSAVYGFGLDPTDFGTGLTLAARHYTLRHPPHVFLSTQLSVPLTFAADPTTGETDVFRLVDLAVPTKLLLNHTVGVYLGDDLLDVTMLPAFGLALNLPLSVGVQASEPVFLQLGTNVARIALEDSVAVDGDRVQWLADRVPLTFTGLYGFSDRLDAVVAATLADVAHPDAAGLGIQIGVNARGGLRSR